ncbi:hypothetical protein NP493_1781g00014 [Ridgeia piscesae]|uniref:Uncharacterized protein n=1 Tax=Ridgeia piscesae TaxID=27915 RepID=A0AAD9N6I2_RIDPI|nr:hypothetical protein NP493_1781g00014 [Ridgeia piscesae]
MYGLSLKLCVQQFKYIPVSDAAGVRLVVHDQTSMPFPEDDGVSSAPGSKTFVGVRRHETTRIDQPYGKCATYTTEENVARNAFVSDVPTVGYSAQIKHYCLTQQKETQEMCSY